MKQLVLSLLLVAASLGARAQEYYIDLGRQRLEVPGRTVAVEQVLDGRQGDLPLGYLYRGPNNNRPLAVAFRKGLGPELTAFIQYQLPARPTDYPLVLCVRQLQLDEEHTLGVGSATAYLNLDAYQHLPDGYHFVQSIASHTSAQAPQVTRLHAGHLALMLSYCLEQLSRADWAAVPAQPARTLAQLPADVPVARPRRPLVARQPAILREQPRRGIYRNFVQFLANQPDNRRALRLDTVQPFLRSFLALQQWQRVPWVRPLVADSLGHWTEPAGIWGFSDGQSVFVQHDQHFFPLHRQGAFFTTVGTALPAEQAQRMQAAARARAGYTTIPKTPPIVTDVPVCYAVDMQSGELAPYPDLRAPTRPDTAYVYVYRPAQAAGPAQVQVWLNGKLAGALRPGQYLELPWPYYALLFSLCLTDGASGSACQHLMPDTAQPNFLRVSFSPEAPLWQWVPPAQGLADLDELDSLRK
ncbi:hypothetical protein [Hymenobacter bucti]|uniref:Uncharacterized protein n=1 Tax=Hymenobacter bucti TaxID=1844114 RepID=A0ABW4QYX4_9BACT